MTTQTLVLLSLLGVSLAAVPLYGQCGGIGYTGDTTCVSGATCVEQNPYYYQCVASGTGTSGGGGGTTTTHTTTVSRTTTTTHTTTTTATTTSSASGPTGTQYCGQWDTVAVGTYTLYLDQWGSGGATSGSDCATVSSISGNTIAWSTTWTWVGGTGVKSFTNIQQNSNANKQLSAIKSIQSTWNWSITNSNGIVADVAYDLFTSSTSGGSNQYEIMIWLANYNAGPISYTYSSSGQPTPVASNVSLGGHTWNVYYGSNGSNYVYSFLPTSGVITSFSADLNAFFQYLTTEQTLSSSQYLVTMQAGTEATTGSNVTLKTSAYSLVVS